MKRLTSWIAYMIIVALLAGCANAGSYVKDHYPLVNVQGTGKDVAKVYSAAGKTVPETAKELAAREHPKEISKEDPNQMFLVYNDKIINIQKDQQNSQNSLIEIDSVPYAKEHYSSSFLQGYLTASLLQSLFGGGWYNHSPPYDYRGYTSVPHPDAGQSGTAPSSSKATKPSTSDRTGSFNSKSAAKNNSAPAAGSTGSSSGSSGSSSSGGSIGKFFSKVFSGDSLKSGTSSYTRKNDGSTPSFKVPSRPRTSSRSGSFSSRRR